MAVVELTAVVGTLRAHLGLSDAPVIADIKELKRLDGIDASLLRVGEEQLEIG